MQTRSPDPWLAGAAEANITPGPPGNSMFLFGYPHVERMSTGVHDPLLASAMCLSDGRNQVLWIACDIIFVPKSIVAAARSRITDAIGIPADHIMIAATHTHSGPITAAVLSNEADSVVPPPDPVYLKLLEDGIVDAAVGAHNTLRPARLDFALADGSGVGTNRRDPSGTCLPQVPVVIARDCKADSFIAVMPICSMHPTVLHEDSTLISGDFPGLTRRYLQKNVIGSDCPFVYHMGASGNQSPRHITRANTFAEAERLGTILGRAIAQAIQQAQPIKPVRLSCISAQIDLPLRKFPSIQDAQTKLAAATGRLDNLRKNSVPSPEVRTAECDWFGAQETLTLSKAATDGRLGRTAAQCLPGEVQLTAIGDVIFAAWPGEAFVEFALELMRQSPRTYIITCANGELQGYIVTADAVAQGGYEASNAIFQSPDSGDLLVQASLKLIDQLHAKTTP